MSEANHEERSPKVAPVTSQSERNRWEQARAVPTADPWQVTSYLISGVTLWGLIGWAAARWLDIPALTGVGFVIGGGLGIWLTYIRYGRPQSGSSASVASVPPSQTPETPDLLATPDLPRASAPSRSQSAQRPSGPPSSDPTAEEEKP
jgi:ATP synthase protein I